MKKILDWLIDKWLAGFITASIFFILKIYIELPTEKKISFFSFSWLKELLSFQISFYIVFILCFIIIFITRIEKKRLKEKINKTSNNKKNSAAPILGFENYKSDLFGMNKTKWTWDYKWNPGEEKFTISDLKPNCDRCDIPMELHRSRFGDSAACHKCNLEGYSGTKNIEEDVADVEKEIIRRIDKKEFEK